MKYIIILLSSMLIFVHACGNQNTDSDKVTEDEIACAEFLSKPYSAQIVAQALIARHFLEDMTAEEIQGLHPDVLREAVKDYQVQMMLRKEQYATGNMDCETVKALGLLQRREIQLLKLKEK
jgi:hypothetical protein